MNPERSLKLHDAVRTNDIKILRRLIAAGADVNIEGRFKTTPLHWAANAGDTQMCLALLQAGANPDLCDSYGSTPLHYAVSGGRPKAVVTLIAHGASLNVATGSGRTPLHLAAESGSEVMCRALLDAGADQFVVDHNGYMAIDVAVKANSVPICRMLEERHPGISAVKSADSYATAFQYAVATGRSAIVRYLVLECGADLDQVNEFGRSLIEIAESDEDMIELLRALKVEVGLQEELAPDASAEGCVKKRPDRLAL